MFPCSLARTINEVDHPWCVSSHGDFFCVYALILRFFNVCDALQRVKSMGYLPRYIQLVQTQIFQVLQISLYKSYYFRNLFKVLSGSCAHACFSPRSMHHSDSISLLSFACHCHPSWGWVARRLLLPESYTLLLVWLASAHCFFNLRGVYQHLGYFLQMYSQPCPICTIA